MCKGKPTLDFSTISVRILMQQEREEALKITVLTMYKTEYWIKSQCKW